VKAGPLEVQPRWLVRAELVVVVLPAMAVVMPMRGVCDAARRRSP